MGSRRQPITFSCLGSDKNRGLNIFMIALNSFIRNTMKLTLITVRATGGFCQALRLLHLMAPLVHGSPDGLGVAVDSPN